MDPEEFDEGKEHKHTMQELFKEQRNHAREFVQDLTHYYITIKRMSRKKAVSEAIKALKECDSGCEEYGI